MKSTMLKFVVAMTIFLLTVPIGLTGQDQKAKSRKFRYSVMNLGNLGGTFGEANGINQKAWVTGISNLPGDQYFHAFLWRNGTMSDLGTFGGNSFVGWPANEAGSIAGYSETSTPDPLGEDFCGNGTGLICLGFVWQNGVMTPLPTLGGNNGNATQINNRGQIVGWAETNTQDQQCIAPQVRDFKAVIWEPQYGHMQELSPLPGDSISAATAINDNGQIVGASGICGTPSSAVSVHAVLWQRDLITDLGSLGGAMNNVAFAINNRGQVAGISDVPGDTTTHAFFWQNGVMTDLGTLPGDTLSIAFGISETSQVDGESCDASGNCRAVVWQGGVISDLNTLASNSSLYLLQADWSNSRGEVVGSAFDSVNSVIVPYLAVPCDDQRLDMQDCKEARQLTIGIQRPKIGIPENLRNQLRSRAGWNPAKR